MIVDTSVVVAILLGESDADEFSAHLESGRGKLSAASYVECSIVADRYARGRPGTQRLIEAQTALARRLDMVIAGADVAVVPFTSEHAHIARQAYRDFGRGSGHPAQLNFGDCFSYALAKQQDEPLLFKGDDFSHTDVRNYLAEATAAAEAAGSSEPPDA